MKIFLLRNAPKVPTPEPVSILDTVSMLDTMTTDDSSDSDSEIEPPSSVRLYSSKPRNLVQRRATITGASPTAKHSVDIEQFWRELKQEHSTVFQLRDKAKAVSCAHGLDNVQAERPSLRPQTCLGIEQRPTPRKTGVNATEGGRKVQFQDVSTEAERQAQDKKNQVSLNNQTANGAKPWGASDSGESSDETFFFIPEFANNHEK